MQEHFKNSLLEARQALDALLENNSAIDAVAASGQALVDCFKSGGKVISCGNGGSHCDAMHFAEELTGRFRKDRPGLPALAISDPSHISCVGNDFGYDEIFARYVEAHGKPGDILLGISTSGSSKNVLRAAEVAKSQGMKVIALTGKPEAALAEFADFHVATPGGKFADRVQELHIKVIHSLIEMVERAMFPDNY